MPDSVTIGFVLALLLAVALSSPMPMPPTCLHWYSKTEHRCRDEDVEIIGPWDPRPGPEEWPHSVYYDPKDWGAYPTEQQRVGFPL